MDSGLSLSQLIYGRWTLAMDSLTAGTLRVTRGGEKLSNAANFISGEISLHSRLLC